MHLLRRPRLLNNIKIIIRSLNSKVVVNQMHSEKIVPPNPGVLNVSFYRVIVTKYSIVFIFPTAVSHHIFCAFCVRKRLSWL